MTKLQSKLKQAGKRRTHRKNVQKRKQERFVKMLERKAAEDSERVETEAARELREQDEAVTGRRERKVTALGALANVDGLVLQQPRKAGKKQLTRKQQTRKDKMRAKGEAISDTLVRKLGSKIGRVKERARTRNSELFT
jgi:hypothetical protein